MGRILVSAALLALVFLAGCVKKVEPKKDVALENAKNEAIAAAGSFM